MSKLSTLKNNSTFTQNGSRKLWKMMIFECNEIRREKKSLGIGVLVVLDVHGIVVDRIFKVGFVGGGGRSIGVILFVLAFIVFAKEGGVKGRRDVVDAAEERRHVVSIGYGLQRGLGGSGGCCTTWACAVPVSGLLPEGAVLNDSNLRHLRIRAGDGDVGGDDEVHDEEGVWQAPLSGDGGAIRHVDHHEFRPIDGGAVDDGVNRLQVLVEERGMAAIPGAENLGDDVEEEALVRWGRVDHRRAAVADQVSDPKLTNDYRLVVEDPIVATISRDVVTADGQPCDPSKGRQINLYVVKIDAAAYGVPVTAEIRVEGPDEGGIEARAALGDEWPQTRRLELVVEVVVPFVLGKQLREHVRRRDRTLGEARVMSSSDSQNVSGQSYGSGSQPSSSFHSESSSPPVTPLIRRPSHQSSSQAREIVAQEPTPLNQLPGRFNPKVLSWDQWEERLGSLGFLALDVRPVFKESSRVTKKVLAEVRTILPPGYKVLSKTTWPNIIEPHQGTRLGFHVASLEGGIIFPLRPFLIEICKKFHVLPGQLTPNAHRFLNCFVNICENMKINPSLELFLHMYEVFPGTSNCPGFVYFHSRNKRGFVTGLPPSHKRWKQRFVFIEFPSDQFPFTNPEWADRVIKPERVHPEPTPELEDACEKLLKGDPVTSKPYAYGGWVYRLPNPDGDVSATHDAGDDRAKSPDGHAKGSSPHPDMNFTRMSTHFEENDDDVQVLHSNWSPNHNPPSPPQNPGMEGASSARCTPLDDLIRDKKVKSPSATHLFEDDRVDSLQAQVESKSKEAGHSSSRAKGHKRKGSQKSSKGDKKKKFRLSDREGESIEETFLALAKKLSKARVISEEIGQSLLEPKDQVSQLTLLLDSAKLEINDRAERERRLEEELKEERARFALLEEERKRKIAELEDALGQAEESARAKEEAFPFEAADWVARHHTEVARSLLTTPEETMDFFKVMYQEPEGKRMKTEIGSYGFQCGQKDERSLLYARLLKREPSFDPAR
ncbi:unnamed protein product [Cuscuta campestris]|uniref:Transposase (putative) gypsy type domain-containing protein n=1 Tax=Cuscuta campestris TaxID=132261 RepID=A0A484M5B9_9ASTE|nr:unnamed protein product [Cuscuta campestris]